MAILSTLLAVSEPTGFWPTIIKAFASVTANYVLAIIFLTVVIRLIWGIIDTYSKYNQQKMNAVQQKMQPELEKIKAKYEKTPEILNQKQNEVYRRYYGKSYYTGCLVMLIVMALNLVIFFTLFSGLNTMASFNIDSSYNNLKFSYANTLNVIDDYFAGNYQDAEKLEYFKDYQSLGIVIDTAEDGSQTISLVKYQRDGEEFALDQDGNKVVEIVLNTTDYKTDFGYIDSSTSTVGGETITEEKAITTNDYIITIINKIFPSYNEGEEEGSKEIVLIEDYEKVLDDEGNVLTDEDGNFVYQDLYLSSAIQNVSISYVVEIYDQTKDSFLWIENYWLADSPTIQSIMSYDNLVAQIGSANIENGEELVYNAFMPALQDARGRVNGYYILPILCVLVSTLSIVLNNLYNKRKSKKEGKEPVKQQGAAKWMQIIIPVMLGIFALFYNSVFAIYMLTGQVVSTIIMPLQLLVVDKLTDRKKKKEDNQTTVDYSRKF